MYEVENNYMGVKTGDHDYVYICTKTIDANKKHREHYK